MSDDEEATVTETAGRGSSDLASGNHGDWPHQDPDEADKHASAERMTAAASGSDDSDDAADAKPGEAADVPVPSEDAAAGSSETFPPVTS
jgi:hypothetical protein